MAMDLKGQTFGRLTVISFSHKDKRGKFFWNCKCICGKEKVIRGEKLRSGNTRSCGCLQREVRGKAKRKHGMTNSKLYTIWLNMKSRCRYPGNTMYHNYGGRGIKYCDEWNDFEEFKTWAENAGYKEGLSLERIDVDGNYEPENCKWIPISQQSLNQRRSHRVTAFGKTQTIKEWADESGIKYDTIERRINCYGWSPEEAVSVPPHGRR